MSKKIWIAIVAGLIAVALLLSPISPISFSQSQDTLVPPGATKSTAERPFSLGEILHSSGNPWSHTFSDVKDIRTATFVVAASDSEHKYQADYRCDGTDDQVQIQEGVDALPAGGGKVVLLEGRFNINDTITVGKPVIFVGAGHSLYTLAVPSNYAGTVLAATPTLAGEMVHVTGAHFGGMFNIGFSGHELPQDEFIATRAINIANAGDYVISHCTFAYLPYNYVVSLLSHGCWVDSCDFEDNTKCTAALELNARRNWVTNCHFRGNYQAILVQNDPQQFIQNCNFEDSQANHIYVWNLTYGTDLTALVLGCRFTTWNQSGGADYAAIEFQADTKNSIIANNYFNGTGCGTPAVWDSDSLTVQYNYIHGNICESVTAPAIDVGTSAKNRCYDQHSDLFTDVLASSANYIVNAQNLVDGAVALTGTQPKYPRGLDCTITEVAGSVTEYTMTVVGTNAKGQTITDVFTFDPDGLTFSSDNAFDHVTSVTLADVADTGNATFVMGIDERLGLMNVIYETSDVWKITKNGTKQTVATAQVDTDYDTYDMSVITLALNDDFEVWYRSSLNIIS